MSELHELAVSAARQAGDAILAKYKRELAVEIKNDGSPLTLADQSAHHTIIAVLSASGLPIVSEECNYMHMEAQRYWLIDPLDGTKDFLVGNDEFTVNIALIEQQRPVLGVVFAPAIDELYVGVLKLGAWSDIAGVCSSCVAAGKSAHIRMAVSRFHDHPDVDIFAASNAINERLSIGSSLKYARLASGDVDVFPRLVGSSEWDTAAGQAVLEAAGGNVFDWHTGEPLRYGKANRRNPRLLALRAPYLFADFTLKYYEQELL